MPQRTSLLLLLLLLPLWLAACYGLRFALMEDGQWVGLCAEQAARWECQARAGLGYLIHLRVLAWGALALAVAGFLLPARSGRVLAGLGLLLGIAALVLYGASLAVFALVLAGLRLVRAPRPA
ncbi:hypothetical protein AAFN46_11530 [Pseudomonas sp. CAU 1711]|uniref:hypothetical protein n=1 Tax=Pseudomonas sp. CAU 1711 TaxID=3140356 RepID=UPI003260590F